MKKYEVFIESIEPCSRDDNTKREIVETDLSPETFLKKNARFPVIEKLKTKSGETIVTTGDGSGNIVKYRFTV